MMVDDALLRVTLAIIIGTLAAIVYSLRVLVLMERRVARMERHIENVALKILAEELVIERKLGKAKPARKTKSVAPKRARKRKR